MGSYHEKLVHGAGLIMTAHAYYNFFAEKKAEEEPMMKMAKAMGVENPTSGMDFIKALDDLIASVGCADLKMSEAGITKDELKLYPQRVHEVLGGDITADPLPLSDADYLEIYEKAYR
ncbi:MAG: alcohol dehydrogenase [Oscillospiraceae bacterium]|nr:alcohol dehydrogenase [Oscillospiraceae bacterium]